MRGKHNRSTLCLVKALSLLTGLLLLLGLSLPAQAKRIALVIGNAGYQNISVLASPRNDAQAMAAALRELGFDVLPPVLDADRKALVDAAFALKGRISKGDDVVIYYSGHAVELSGNNYLLPIDAPPRSQVRELERLVEEALRLQRFLEVANEKGARFTLAIFDACRDNPIQHVKGDGSTGLIAPPLAAGQMVMYAAGWKELAKDKLGRDDRHPNSVFTRVLLEEIRKPGISAAEMARAVRDRVASLAAAVGHQQVPALYDQSLGTFIFAAAAGKGTNNDSTSTESIAWSIARRANNALALNAYLERYPHGRYAEEARAAMDQLGGTAFTYGQRRDAEATPTSPRSFALLLGVGRLKHLPKKNWLTFAEKDAKDFHSFLTTDGGISRNAAILLRDEEATAMAVRGAMRKLMQEAQPRDTVVFFAAAQGLPNAMGKFDLILYDTQFGTKGGGGHAQLTVTDRTSTLADDELQEFISQLMLKDVRTVVVLDGGYSGKILSVIPGFVPSGYHPAAPDSVAGILRKPKEEPGTRIVIASASENEEALETPDIGGSLFTQVYLAALKQTRDWRKAFDLARPTVMKRAKTVGMSQTPRMLIVPVDAKANVAATPGFSE